MKDILKKIKEKDKEIIFLKKQKKELKEAVSLMLKAKRKQEHAEKDMIFIVNTRGDKISDMIREEDNDGSNGDPIR